MSGWFWVAPELEVRTECTIDVIQATSYLGQAVVFLYKALGSFVLHEDEPQSRYLFFKF